MASHRYVELFTNQCEKEFAPHGIKIKKDKSKILVNTNEILEIEI